MKPDYSLSDWLFDMLRLLIAVVVISAVIGFAFCTARAQPNHIGVLYNAQFESGGGNGSIQGVEAQGVYTLRLAQQRLQVAANAQFTRDYKVYLGYAGNAQRINLRARWFIPKARGLFLQGAGYAGHVAYKGEGGYEKSLKQPGFGGGYVYEDTQSRWSVGVNYTHLFHTTLRNQAKQIDGATWANKVGYEGTIRIRKTPWLALINISHGQYAYRRDGRLYGETLAGTVHYARANEISFGLAYKFSE